MLELAVVAGLAAFVAVLVTAVGLQAPQAQKLTAATSRAPAPPELRVVEGLVAVVAVPFAVSLQAHHAQPSSAAARWAPARLELAVVWPLAAHVAVALILMSFTPTEALPCRRTVAAIVGLVKVVGVGHAVCVQAILPTG